MNPILKLLAALLLAPLALLDAADVQGQEKVKLRLGFADDADCKVIGNVKVGIALEGDELAASLARGGDGKVARFEGGRLFAGDAKPVWQIVFDRNNEGGAKQWVREKYFPREQQREIAVPSCWELIEKDYEGVAF